jgi:ribosomal protein S18 acetylase RimI-like enzyme
MGSTAAITLRLARRTDAGVIAAMSRDFIETGLGWRYSADRVARLISERDTCALVACDAQGRVQGFAIMHFGELRAHLVLLCVRPERRRLGVGRSMIEWLLESARVAGIESLHLELRADNESAKAFYGRLGFTDTAVVPGYYDARVPAQRMVLVLRETPPS